MTAPALFGHTEIYGTRTSDRWFTQPGRMDPLNLRVSWSRCGQWGIPELEPCSFVPESLAAWHLPIQRAAAAGNGALHFFLDDYRFERVWSRPDAALGRVGEVGAALTPDFSLWRGMPLAAQLWQVYRSRWVGAYWQHHDLPVIPTAMWSTPESYDFVFEGMPQRSVVAVGAVGVVRDVEARELFRLGMRELLDRARPSKLLVYGRLPDCCDTLDLPAIREYPTFWDRRRKRA